MKQLIKAIAKKEIEVTNIFKSKISQSFSIEVVTKNPIEFISLLFKTEEERDNNYTDLDNKAFWYLTFNPNTPIPGPLCSPPSVTPLIYPPVPVSYRGYDDSR